MSTSPVAKDPDDVVVEKPGKPEYDVVVVAKDGKEYVVKGTPKGAYTEAELKALAVHPAEANFQKELKTAQLNARRPKRK